MGSRRWTGTSTTGWSARSGRGPSTPAGAVPTAGSTATSPGGTLLVVDGRLAAVIDFGTSGAGDPACDLAIARALLTPDGREAFRERLSVDDATRARGRGWAPWKTLATSSSTLDDPGAAEEHADARRVLGEICSEYATGTTTGPEPGP